MRQKVNEPADKNRTVYPFDFRTLNPNVSRQRLRICCENGTDIARSSRRPFCSIFEFCRLTGHFRSRYACALFLTVGQRSLGGIAEVLSR